MKGQAEKKTAETSFLDRKEKTDIIEKPLKKKALQTKLYLGHRRKKRGKVKRAGGGNYRFGRGRLGLFGQKREVQIERAPPNTPGMRRSFCRESG